ncbi:putative cytochrome P450 [Trypanosoma cruzi]|nr:putative cytochrome P450 [Trypanosoma cruzi]
MKLTPLRGQPSFSRNGEGRNDCRDAGCVAFVGTKRLHAMPEAHPEEFTRSADGREKAAEGPPAAYEGGRQQPHPFHRLPPSAPHHRRFIRTFELPDAIVEKGNGAYPLPTLDCGTKHRQFRRGPGTGGGRTRRLERCVPRQRGSRQCL